MQEFDRNITTWETESGDRIFIKDLTESHLVNIINHMSKPDKCYEMGFREFMEQEADFRRTLAFFNNRPMPKKIAFGDYELENV